jgi:tetratricopeptide (TPR) repeat protein
MARCLLTALAALLLGLAAAAQSPDNPQKPATPASQTNADQQTTADQNSQLPSAPQDDTTKKDDAAKKKGIGQRVRDQFGSGCTPFGCWGNEGPKAKSDADQQASTKGPENQPPRSDESSSRDTKISLAPPPGEPGYAPGAEPNSDVQEMHPWDPHKAEKSIEVGIYYLRQRNYPAAISRFQEALYWKANDALAQFRLGQALEAVGQYAEARKNYLGYLKILPHGEFSQEAQTALARLRDKPDDPSKSTGPVL